MRSISESLPPDPTVHDVANCLWKPRIAPLAHNTVRRYTGAYVSHIRDPLGRIPARSLTRAIVQRWANSLKLEPAGVHFALSVLGNVMKEAQIAGIVERNPVWAISKPKRPGKRHRILDLEEALGLIEAMDQTPISCPVYLAAVLGLRRGEVAGLKWEDLDRTQGKLRIVRQRQGVTRKGVVETRLKSSASARTLTLPKEIIDGIDARGDLDSEWVCTYGGLPWVPDTIWEIWRARRPKALEAWTFHDLRHLAAGLLYASGAGLQEIASVLGQEKPDMAFLYASIREGQAAEAIAKLGRRMAR